MNAHRFEPLTVLHEDNHCIVVIKSAGMLSQGDYTGRPTMMDAVKTYLRSKYKKPGNVFVGLVHRLDRQVAGIMMFAKTSKGQQRLCEQFRNRTIEKTYHGVVIGRPQKDTGHLTNTISKVTFFAQAVIEGVPLAQRRQQQEPQSRTAELVYEVIQSNGQFSLVKFMPHTGRFHQIRIQTAAMGHPLVGDTKYGAPRPLPDRSIALMATGLIFTTPTSGERITLSLPIPERWMTMTAA